MSGREAGRHGVVGEAKFVEGDLVEWRLTTGSPDEDRGTDLETWIPVDAVVPALPRVIA